MRMKKAPQREPEAATAKRQARIYPPYRTLPRPFPRHCFPGRRDRRLPVLVMHVGGAI